VTVWDVKDKKFHQAKILEVAGKQARVSYMGWNKKCASSLFLSLCPPPSSLSLSCSLSPSLDDALLPPSLSLYG